jgi:hypothetical protein
MCEKLECPSNRKNGKASAGRHVAEIKLDVSLDYCLRGIEVATGKAKSEKTDDKTVRKRARGRKRCARGKQQQSRKKERARFQFNPPQIYCKKAPLDQEERLAASPKRFTL